jgi:glycerate kinase
MKLAIAMDKFKGSLSAAQACEAVRRGVMAVCPDTDITVKPMADGGEGTVEAVLLARRGGERVVERVRDPLGREVEAAYAWFKAEQWAVVEMAQASGLHLLRPDEYDPLRATTFGTGQLMASAIGRGARRISRAVGGSATVDGGVGAAMALGWQFLDADGVSVGRGGGDLHRIAKIVAPALREAIPDVEVWCDVDNPLCGPTGGAHVFGPQKGATPAVVEQLDAGLWHLADVVREQLGVEIDAVPGAGAAGGLSAGALAFCRARLVSGIERVMEVSRIDDVLRDADWVVTGEGRFDEQSLRGKAVQGIVRRACARGVRVAVLAGDVALAETAWRAAGIDSARGVRPPEMPVAAAMEQAEDLLATAAREWAARNISGQGTTHEFFEHTADIGVRVLGGTTSELFVNAARAMYEAMGRFTVGARSEPRTVTIEADDLGDLLHDWLGELLFDLEAHHLFYDRLAIDRLEAGRLVARLEGGTIDFDQSQTNEEIKAVTYHQLEVEQGTDGIWRATVIFDV